MVLTADGLGLRMPKDESFDVDDVVNILGAVNINFSLQYRRKFRRIKGGDVIVDTNDVYAQRSTSMSLASFRTLWHANERKRLYNILSLEFSDTE